MDIRNKEELMFTSIPAMRQSLFFRHSKTNSAPLLPAAHRGGEPISFFMVSIGMNIRRSSPSGNSRNPYRR